MNLGGNNRRLILGVIAGLVLGILIGMALFWGPLKVKYAGARSYDMIAEEKAKYVMLVADSYAADHDQARADSFLRGTGWTDDEVQRAIADAVAVNEAEGRPAEVQRLRDLQAVLGYGQGAQPTAAPGETPAPPTGQPTIVDRLAKACIVFIVVLLALIIIYFVVRSLMRRRAAPAAPAQAAPRPAPITAQVAPPEEWKGVGQPPLGHFITTYKLGEDTYDESFSIETPAGEFLGECGVGISETIGKGEPDKVTAFEVWLFDKSDIRTVTKVLMSDHAFHDEALRAKLLPKGEAVLAEVGVPFMLETTGLQVQVTATDVAYGEGPLPPKSFFRQLTIELVAMGRAA